MIQIVKNIKGELLTQSIGNIEGVSKLSGVVKEEDYIELYGFVGYTQNFTNSNETVLLTNPLNFGLKNKLNLPINNLEIDY